MCIYIIIYEFICVYEASPNMRLYKLNRYEASPNHIQVFFGALNTQMRQPTTAPTATSQTFSSPLEDASVSNSF